MHIEQTWSTMCDVKYLAIVNSAIDGGRMKHSINIMNMLWNYAGNNWYAIYLLGK